MKSKLAAVLGIHGAFLSQVLKDQKELSLEQIERLARFLRLSESETEYLILLHQENRAATLELKSFLQKRMDKIRVAQTDVSQRRRDSKTLSETDQRVYYSHWLYAAIHVALSLPQLRAVDALARHFRISEPRIQEILGFLVEIGLAEKKQDEYYLTERHVVLSKNSPMITQHHTNIKYKALESVIEKNPDDLHYSSYYTFSAEDYPVIRDIWYRAIEEMQQKVGPSASENLYVLSLDLFKI
jgi:uncharacterized protein (TIGR02147 family)